MSDTVGACPECDSASVQTVINSGFDAEATDHNYKCRSCAAEFDQLVQRESKNQCSPKGLAGELDSMNADQLFGGAD